MFGRTIWILLLVLASTESFAAGSRTRFPSGVSSCQQSNIESLVRDLTAIQAGAAVTQQQKDALTSAFNTLAQGTTRPDPELVKGLMNDLAVAFADGSLSQSEVYKLVLDGQDIAASMNIPPSEIQAVTAAAIGIWAAVDVSSEETQAIVDDLRTISAEFRHPGSTCAVLG